MRPGGITCHSAARSVCSVFRELGSASPLARTNQWQITGSLGLSTDNVPFHNLKEPEKKEESIGADAEKFEQKHGRKSAVTCLLRRLRQMVRGISDDGGCYDRNCVPRACARVLVESIVDIDSSSCN